MTPEVEQMYKGFDGTRWAIGLVQKGGYSTWMVRDTTLLKGALIVPGVIPPVRPRYVTVGGIWQVKVSACEVDDVVMLSLALNRTEWPEPIRLGFYETVLEMAGRNHQKLVDTWLMTARS